MTARSAVLISDRILFRKTFSKMLKVLDPALTVQELTGELDADTLLPDAESGVVLVDAGSQDEAGVEERLFSVLTRQPEAAVTLVIDEQDDALVEAAMAAGAQGVMIKAAPPQVLIDMLQRGLNGERFRPAPTVVIAREDIPEEIRQQLTARQQKLLRLMMGGQSISTTASELGMTPAKVVTEMRAVTGLIRGRRF